MSTGIVGHQNMDFDCVSSMVAARCLHPGARMYLQPTVEGTVREFLNLYRGQYGFLRYGRSRTRSPDTLIVVDTNRASRLGPYEEWLDSADRVILYDHHPESELDFQTDERYVDRDVGALITSMVERIIDRNLRPTALEATLFMLGLHQETGSLQFGTATERDYRVGTFLMSSGADLDVVQQFYQSYLDEDQRSLFMQLLENLQDREINGFRISFALAEVDDYVPEIALITHKLRDAENLNVLVTLVEMGDRVQVVLRSRVDQVDVGELARAFGGGGHPRASSVTMGDYSLETAREAIERWLLENLQSGLRARDLMSSPVHTVRPDLSLEEAQRVMLRLGHGGMPVVDEDEQLVGVITRHDVDQAMEHELMHAPVKGFMNPDVITADPEDGLMELKNRIIHNQVGRLPVVKGDHLLGIVTRSDIIRALHDREMGEPGDGEFETVRSRSEDVSVNVEPRVENHFDEEGLEALRRWGSVVDEWDDSLFLVGGCVRDLLLDRPVKDLDLVVEQDGLRFARYLRDAEDCSVSVHEPFQTAEVTLPGGRDVDVATARSEYYSRPAALPEVEVEHTSVRQDLRRRDFTINAMAVDLSPDRFGRLLDPFGGLKDLDEGRIRVLHSMSFQDDPTRLLRAIRFAGRFDFELDEATRHYMNQAVSERIFDPVSGDRIREELDRVMEEPRRAEILTRMEEVGVLGTLHRDLTVPDGFTDHARAAEELIGRYQPRRPVMVYYCLVFDPLSARTRDFLCRRWNFSRERRRIVESYEEFEDLRDGLRKAGDDATVYRLIESIGHWEALLARRAREDRRIRRAIRLYLDDLVRVEPLVDGDDLAEWGMDPGPEMGDLLDELFDHQLNHDIRDPGELKEYALSRYPEAFGVVSEPEQTGS